MAILWFFEDAPACVRCGCTKREEGSVEKEMLNM
jgi:hypothetical protein